MPTFFQSAFISTSVAVLEGVGKSSDEVFTLILSMTLPLSLSIRNAATALSGVGNTGIFKLLNIACALGAKFLDPVRATAIGILRILLTPPRAAAIRSTSAPTRTAKQAIIESTPLSCAKISKHFSNKSGEDITAAVTSTGLFAFPYDGMIFLSSAKLSGANSASSRPCASRASVAKIPLPPEVVIIATLFPSDFTPDAKIKPASNSCSTSSTRTAPVALIAASIIRSSVASAPV